MSDSREQEVRRNILKASQNINNHDICENRLFALGTNIFFQKYFTASSPAEGLQLKVPTIRARSSSPISQDRTPIPWLNRCKLNFSYTKNINDF